MNRQLSLILLPLMGLVLGAATCDKQGRKVLAECEGVICTMMFAAVTVQVQDAAGAPVVLDSSVTLRVNNGIRVHTGAGNSAGVYTVVDDSYQKELAMRTERFLFSGYLGGRKVVEQEFSVSADCCHVSRKDGPAVINLK